MNIQELLHNIGNNLAGSASVKSIYGEAVTVGNRTVIPIATVRYGFGGGGGEGKGSEERNGGGVGGGVVAMPCGALEITPEGTRFLEFPDHRRTAMAMAVGILLGVIVSRRTKSRRV